MPGFSTRISYSRTSQKSQQGNFLAWAIRILVAAPANVTSLSVKKDGVDDDDADHVDGDKDDCEEPAPSVRSCILLLHRNHRAPSNLCHSEPSSFLYLTSIKLKHASVQELRNHYRTIKSNKVPPCKSTHQGRAPPWQHRPTRSIEHFKKHCQRHNRPEGWVHITSSNTNLDQISSSESRLSINFSTKHQHLQLT